MPYPLAAARNRYTSAPVSALPMPPQTLLAEWWNAGAQSYADGDPVGDLVPSAPGASTLTATLLFRPTWKAAILNGQPVLRFNGANGMQIAAFIGGSIAQPNTVCWISKHAAASSGPFEVYFDNVDGQPGRQLAYRDGSGNDAIFAGAATSGGADNGTAWHTYRAEFSGPSSKLYQDGSMISSGDAGANAQSSLTLGALGTLGAGFGFLGDIPELLIYNGLLSGANVTTLAAYWLARYGLVGA